MRNVARTPIVVVILLLAASVVSAADNRELVGQNVTVVNRDAKVYNPNRQVASDASVGTSYLVNGVQGDWLQIGDNGLLRRSDVVPEKGALEYFNALVHDKPSAESNLARGSFYLDQEMPEEAVTDFTVAIESAPARQITTNTEATPISTRKITTTPWPTTTPPSGSILRVPKRTTGVVTLGS